MLVLSFTENQGAHFFAGGPTPANWIGRLLVQAVVPVATLVKLAFAVPDDVTVYRTSLLHQTEPPDVVEEILGRVRGPIHLHRGNRHSIFHLFNGEVRTADHAGYIVVPRFGGARFGLESRFLPPFHFLAEIDLPDDVLGDLYRPLPHRRPAP